MIDRSPPEDYLTLRKNVRKKYVRTLYAYIYIYIFTKLENYY